MEESIAASLADSLVESKATRIKRGNATFDKWISDIHQYREESDEKFDDFYGRLADRILRGVVSAIGALDTVPVPFEWYWFDARHQQLFKKRFKSEYPKVSIRFGDGGLLFVEADTNATVDSHVPWIVVAASTALLWFLWDEITMLYLAILA